MPARLRPTAPNAPDAVLVGDPGRALMLAQVLLAEPKMSNHARGLWGYSGETPAGRPLTIQATGMGGPSAALVLADLAELGVQRAVRVGSGSALRPEVRSGELLVISEAHSWDSPSRRAGEKTHPDPALHERLKAALGGEASEGVAASLDGLHVAGAAAPVAAGEIADMQTAALFARARDLGVAIAAVLIVVDGEGGPISDEDAEAAAAKAGKSAAAALSNPQVEG
jgi:uridine phosphorylase